MFHCGIISSKKKNNFTNSLGNKACAWRPKLKQANFRFCSFLSYYLSSSSMHLLMACKTACWTICSSTLPPCCCCSAAACLGLIHQALGSGRRCRRRRRRRRPGRRGRWSSKAPSTETSTAGEGWRTRGWITSWWAGAKQATQTP
jgi:hypothetical protein